jgi:glycosyltransferase involved in cell wall biosynthesis
VSKKIVILINSLNGGGAERVVSTLLNSFVENYECYLILMEDKISYKLDSRVNILNLNEKSNQYGLVKLLRIPLLAYKLSRIINEHKFIQVVSFLARSNYINIISSYSSNHNTIISERAMPSLQYKSGLSGKINKFLIRKLYNKADLCISNSQGNRRDLVDNFNVANITSIPNPFDIKMIHKLSKRTIRQKKNRFTFVSIGRLDRGKNHKLIIDAMKDIDADLWIIGDGKLKNYLKAHIEDLNLVGKVFLLGQSSNPFAYLSKADCFVFASNHEGFPNVLVEALACGLALISTDCQSGPREILAPGSDINFQLGDHMELGQYGILTPVNNEEELKKSMRLMINNEELKFGYQEKSTSRASYFKSEKIIEEYKKAICVE